jgi:hypothetical protein
MSPKRRIRKHVKKQYSFEPKYLKHQVMIATGALVVCLFVAAGVVERVVREMHTPYVAAVIASVLVNLANQDREALALPTLEADPLLTAAAQAKADDMAEKGYFSHTTPEGYDSWHWFEEVGYKYQYAGENLAVNFVDSSDVQKAWMNSPTHRDNIVNPKYTEIGIATAVGVYEGRQAVFAVQMFGRPQESAPVIAVAEAAALPLAEPPAPASSDVLGEQVEVVAPYEEAEIGALAEQDLPAGQAGGDASILTAEQQPWWAFLVAQPRHVLQYAYYVIGLLILAALFFDVEWELHRHHMRHAVKAGALLGIMSMLFVVADWVFFAEPVLAIAQLFG